MKRLHLVALLVGGLFFSTNHASATTDQQAIAAKHMQMIDSYFENCRGRCLEQVLKSFQIKFEKINEFNRKQYRDRAFKALEKFSARHYEPDYQYTLSRSRRFGEYDFQNQRFPWDQFFTGFEMSATANTGDQFGDPAFNSPFGLDNSDRYLFNMANCSILGAGIELSPSDAEKLLNRLDRREVEISAKIRLVKFVKREGMAQVGDPRWVTYSGFLTSYKIIAGKNIKGEDVVLARWKMEPAIQEDFAVKVANGHMDQGC
jgi:hypothetical protein